MADELSKEDFLRLFDMSSDIEKRLFFESLLEEIEEHEDRQLMDIDIINRFLKTDYTQN